MDDQTAWEEINPVLRRESSVPAVASLPAALEVRLADIHDLQPVSRGEFFSEIAPCLTLAAGVGMSQPDQDAWFEAAFIALAGIPIGLLRRGVKAAMLKADHPSKIIPTISAEIEDSWNWRRANPEAYAAPEPAPPERQIEAPMTPAEIEEFNAIMARIGASTRYRPDGSRYQAETQEARAEARGPQRKPTRQDYLDMGVDPAVMDSIETQNNHSQSIG
jgi:hypothetical protein